VRQGELPSIGLLQGLRKGGAPKPKQNQKKKKTTGPRLPTVEKACEGTTDSRNCGGKSGTALKR